MKTSPVYQFVFRVLAVFALTAGLFLGTEGGSSAQDETIGTPEHPIKILFTPYVDAQVILDGGEVMVNYLQQVTGLIFEINVPLSDAATVEEMCASPDDSMGFLPGFSYVLANDLCGVDVSYKAIMYGWDVNWSEILVPRDSTIQSVADLDGLTWGIPEYSSYSGYMTPMAMWNRAGITPGEVIETGGHSQAVMAVYSGAVDFATTYFSPPRKPAEDPAWQPGDDPDIPDNLVNDCGISQDGKLMCGEWRVMDARTMILSDAPDVVQKVRILEISPPGRK
ncbi:PhnD/SsuA/transferrin family substrate-binding protein [Chloroflexota bacterium]